jgi:hypothetical protein
MKKLCEKYPNVILMDKTSVLIDGVRILGTTLWSHVPDDKRKIVEYSINDYHLINIWKGNPPKLQKITCDDTNFWHREELQWLQQQVISTFIVVVSSFDFISINSLLLLLMMLKVQYFLLLHED